MLHLFKKLQKFSISDTQKSLTLANLMTENGNLLKKINVQERALQRGESEYKEREEDVRVLKIEVKRLRTEESALIKNSQNMEELKKEMLHLQKDLLQQKNKVKSLQTELENLSGRFSLRRIGKM